MRASQEVNSIKAAEMGVGPTFLDRRLQSRQAVELDTLQGLVHRHVLIPPQVHEVADSLATRCVHAGGITVSHTFQDRGLQSSQAVELDALHCLVHRHVLIAPQAYKVVDSSAQAPATGSVTQQGLQ